MASHGALPIAFAVLLCSSFLLTQCTVVAASVSSLSSHEQEQEQEIRRLRSKVASLEDEVSGRKEETSQLESLVREKTAQIAALVGGLEVLQVTNVADDESVMKASTNSAMLEEQIERLGNDLEDQVKKGESLEARASEAEKSLLELGQKLEHVSTHVHVLNSQCLLWDMLWHWVGRRICHVIHMFFRLRRSISSRGRKSRSWNIIFRMQSFRKGKQKQN